MVHDLDPACKGRLTGPLPLATPHLPPADADLWREAEKGWAP